MKKLNLIITLCLLISSAIFCQNITNSPSMPTAPRTNIPASEETSTSVAPDPFSTELLNSFADDLYTNGFFDEAEQEYKRSLFLWENKIKINQGDVSSEIKDFSSMENVILTLSSIYNCKKNKEGIAWLTNNYYEKVNVDVKEKIALANFRFNFLERTASSFFDWKTATAADQENFSIPVQMAVLISADLLNKDITSANVKATAAAREFQIFADFAQASASYNTKSPALATVLSIFIPGSGKWYTGSFSAFFSSFLSISSFVAGTIYTGIESEWKNWRPYVFGSCALVLYITDIYGSYQSAKRYNDAQFRILCESMDSIYEEIY